MWGQGGAAIRRNLGLWLAVARLSPLPFGVLALTIAGPAGAAEVACRFEAGTITLPAVVAGIAGDYILDTGAAQTTLHNTKAEERKAFGLGALLYLLGFAVLLWFSYRRVWRNVAH